MYLPNNTLLQSGKYRIVRFLKSGGFGCTYEAEHTRLHKRLAIKEFFVKTFCNRDGDTHHVTVATQSNADLVKKLKKKFLDEAAAISQMHHAHIVNVSDVFEENGTAYYVMDFIDGQSLNDMIKSAGPLSEERALRYIRQVADALRYVHRRNRLHLDIKPGNIMVDGDDDAQLIDFGASKQYDEENGENTSSIVGKTPGYAPLEQMSSKIQNFAPATDIYSLGATLYKLLTGITPPDATDRADDDSALQPLPARISPTTRQAVTAAMQVRRKERPQSIDAFLALLDGKAVAKDEETIKETPKAVPTPKAEPTPAEPKEKPAPKPKDRKMLVIALLVVAVVVMAVLFFIKGNSNAAPDEAAAPTDSIIAAADSTDLNQPDPESAEIEEAAAEQPAKEEPAKTEPVKEEPAKPVKEEPAKSVEEEPKGTPEDWYNKGASYYNQKDYLEALPWLKKAAEQGHARAQFRLGWMYYAGEGVQQDYAEAVKWYKKAAEQGNALAQYNLGVMYERGYGVEKDYAEAVKWYKKAAEQGHSVAQCNLGVMYHNGYGVKKDYAEAVKWYKKSAEQGNAWAQYNLGICYENGYGVEKDYAEAKKWYQKAADQGDEDAKKALRRLNQ